jgi:hypothetical protein
MTALLRSTPSGSSSQKPPTTTIWSRRDDSRELSTVGPSTGSAKRLASLASANTEPLTHSSGRTTNEAPSAAARAIARLARSRPYSGSPSRGASWAQAILIAGEANDSAALTFLSAGNITAHSKHDSE